MFPTRGLVVLSASQFMSGMPISKRVMSGTFPKSSVRGRCLANTPRMLSVALSPVGKVCYHTSFRGIVLVLSSNTTYVCVLTALLHKLWKADDNL